MLVTTTCCLKYKQANRGSDGFSIWTHEKFPWLIVTLGLKGSPYLVCSFYNLCNYTDLIRILIGMLENGKIA